jgi:signal peptidase I
MCLGILLAGLILIRQGFVLRDGIVSGSSMEPLFQGPRLMWTCLNCSRPHEFARDTCQPDRPIRCPNCGVAKPDSVVDFSPEKVKAGERVRYAPVRMMRSIRSKAQDSGEVHPSGIRRGDAVVLRENPTKVKEIKRIVGFPGESISIESGDLFVDGKRFSKTLAQTLRQSILVDSWQREPSTSSNSTLGNWLLDSKPFESGILEGDAQPNFNQVLRFETRSGSYLDNQLSLNAHDSHRIVAANDIGVAIQLGGESSMKSEIQVELRTQVYYECVSLHFEPSSLRIVSKDASKTIALSELNGSSPQQTPTLGKVPTAIPGPWIIVAMIDGFLLIGTPATEFVREKLHDQVSVSDDNSRERDATRKVIPAEIHLVGGKLAVDRILVFRDILYRGQLDSDRQEWDAEEGVVLLGDNVSASGDSRDRWPNRPRITAIKGIVLEPSNPIEKLLTQR